MQSIYGAAYQGRDEWHAVSIGLSRTYALDAAIRMYDAGKSLASYGWDADWPREKKAAFLRKRGMRVKEFFMTTKP